MSVRTALLPLAACLLWASPSSGGSALAFVADSDEFDAGEFFEVALVISGLAQGKPPSVGAYSINVFFDDTVLAAVNLDFGDQLSVGGLMPGQDVFTGSGFITGLEDAIQGVLSNGAIIEANQASDFTLFVITFEAIGGGEADLRTIISFLDDAANQSLGVENTSVGITVVPEPPIGVSGAVAVGAVLLLRRIRARALPGKNCSIRVSKLDRRTWPEAQPARDLLGAPSLAEERIDQAEVFAGEALVAP